MKRSEIKIIPEYFNRYIELVDDIELFEAFNESIRELNSLDFQKLEMIGQKTYLPGKWTINDIFQHIADVERLLAAGALRFARGEENFVISFNEEHIAKMAGACKRNLGDIIDELKSVRYATIALFRSFDFTDFQRSGINWKYRISNEAMGFNIIGHQIHHLNFIKTHYYLLI